MNRQRWALSGLAKLVIVKTYLSSFFHDHREVYGALHRNVLAAEAAHSEPLEGIHAMK